MPATTASTMLACRSMPPVRSIATMHEHYGVFLVHLSPLKYTPNSQLTKVCNNPQIIDFYIFFIYFNEKRPLIASVTRYW
nr:hypothetical protein [uncultured Comamonas sp.]